ncbi:YdhR family protein [Methanobacterium aggregans]|uniref:YdhR family protein n=1 Tax=Methanobacterium aggregans TaxID=1615586 RepID=UPI001AE23ADC|nr:YdhR family protein [Methanobacterium aggregans]MBP2045734.1 hypothetical protein [Methanobacterium aggregans]
MSFNPIYAFIKTTTGIVTHKIRFQKDDLGKTIQMNDGYRFTILKHAVKASETEDEGEPTVLCLRFHLEETENGKDIKHSRLPMFFSLGLPGLREKIWMVNKWNGDFQGIYEWDSEENAHRYVDSFAMKFMTRNAVPGSVKYEIIPRISLHDHVRHLQL